MKGSSLITLDKSQANIAGKFFLGLGALAYMGGGGPIGVGSMVLGSACWAISKCFEGESKTSNNIDLQSSTPPVQSSTDKN